MDFNVEKDWDSRESFILDSFVKDWDKWKVNDKIFESDKISSYKITFKQYFNIQLIKNHDLTCFLWYVNNDVPLFIDPYLIKVSTNPNILEWKLYISNYIINYIWKEIIDKSFAEISEKLLFQEISNTNLWVTSLGNDWHWLWKVFANHFYEFFKSMDSSYNIDVDWMFYLEILSVYFKNVGKDKISDFITNILHYHLCEYTEAICKQYIKGNYNYEIVSAKQYLFEDWKILNSISKCFKLPSYNWKYLLLVPKEILVKDNYLINRKKICKDILNETMFIKEYDNLSYEVALIRNNKSLKQNEKEEQLLFLIQENPLMYKYYYNYNIKSSLKEKSVKKASLQVELENIFINDLYFFIYKEFKINSELSISDNLKLFFEILKNIDNSSLLELFREFSDKDRKKYFRMIIYNLIRNFFIEYVFVTQSSSIYLNDSNIKIKISAICLNDIIERSEINNNYNQGYINFLFIINFKSFKLMNVVDTNIKWSIYLWE